MEQLISNDEQSILASLGQGPKEDLPTNVRELFVEADEVEKQIHILIEQLRVKDADIAKCRIISEGITKIWREYLEQPGLLDPHLEKMVCPLMKFVTDEVQRGMKTIEGKCGDEKVYIVKKQELNGMHLVCSLLYVLQLIRGFKRVIRLYPHEAADLEICLEFIEVYSNCCPWSTKYILLLWLSMILLTPFDLSTIGNDIPNRVMKFISEHLKNTGRLRDASSFLLARLVSRKDAQYLWDHFVADFQVKLNEEKVSAFEIMGYLQGIKQILKLNTCRGSEVWSAGLEKLFRGMITMCERLLKQGVVRKLRISTLTRIALTSLPPRIATWRYQRGNRILLESSKTVVSSSELNKSGDGEENDDDDDDVEVADEIEEIIDVLLDALNDQDTVVRWAAAKGIGRITMRLSKELADQVVESLLERSLSSSSCDKGRHGGCLAIAELARRGLLMPHRFEVVVPLVCDALVFEQLLGQHAVGQHVRDSACFCIWSFARAYSPEVLQPFVDKMAFNLLQVAIFDREINCRRAAAAAVQEHVGRQGTFPHGIDVVTICDYWSVSSRPKSFLEVAPKIAALRREYRIALIQHLLLKKIDHQDIQIRQLASKALAILCEDDYLNEKVIPFLVAMLLGNCDASDPLLVIGGQIAKLSGSLSQRHCALLAVAEIVKRLSLNVNDENQKLIRNLVPNGEKARIYRGRGGESLRVAACQLIDAICRRKDSGWEFKNVSTAKRYLQTVEECLRHSGEDGVQWAAASALSSLANLRLETADVLVVRDRFLHGLSLDCEISKKEKKEEQEEKKEEQEENEESERNENVDSCFCSVSQRRGWLLGLGVLPSSAVSNDVKVRLRREIVGGHLVSEDLIDPESRRIAALSLGRLLEKPDILLELGDVQALTRGCADFTVDRRGDIGLSVREICTEAMVSWGLHVAEVFDSLLQESVDKIDRARILSHDLMVRLLHGPRHTMFESLCRWSPIEESLPVSYIDDNGESANLQAFSSSIVKMEGNKEVKKFAADFAESKVLVPNQSETEEINSLTAVPNSFIDRLKKIFPPDQRLEGSNEDATLFHKVIPLLDIPRFRKAILASLVTSVGGITELTAKSSSQVFLAQMEAWLNEGLSKIEIQNGTRNGTQDGIPDKNILFVPEKGCAIVFGIYQSFIDLCYNVPRLRVSLMTTLTLLLKHGLIVGENGEKVDDDKEKKNGLDNLVFSLFKAVKYVVDAKVKDVALLMGCSDVFCELVSFPYVRMDAVSIILKLLGHTYPKVRLHTAKSLYLKFLEVDSEDFDMGSFVRQDEEKETYSKEEKDEEKKRKVSCENIDEVLEILSTITWSDPINDKMRSNRRRLFELLYIPVPEILKLSRAELEKRKDDLRQQKEMSEKDAPSIHTKSANTPQTYEGHGYKDLVQECHLFR